MTNAEPPKTTLRGIVIPATWNENGAVLSLAIATFSEEKIFVANTPAGQRLMSHLRTAVKVEGTLKTEGGKRMIEVDNFAAEAPLSFL